MKRIIAILILFLFIQCHAQNSSTMKKPFVDNSFEKFDVEKFESHRKNKNSQVIVNDSNVDFTQQLQIQSYGYIDRRFLKEDYFVIIRKFYKNKSIMTKGLFFIEGSKVGIWYHFDEDGSLIKEENTDEGYDFGPDQVIAYCESNKIELPKGYHDSGFQTEVIKSEKDGKKVWVISHLLSSGDKIEKITLDGKTGKVLDKKIVQFIGS